MRESIIALTTAVSRSAGEHKAGLGSSADVVMVAMAKEARGCWLAPTEDEAFVSWVAALVGVYPEKRDLILEEAKAIGDRTKILNAMVSGVPVDFENVVFADFPEGHVGLIKIWHESREV